MAAMATTVTLDTGRAEYLRGKKILIGTANVTNYHSTNVAVTEISRAFKGPFTVIFGISDSGLLFQWTGTSIKVWTGAAGVNAEAADDSVGGTAEFIAIGI